MKNQHCKKKRKQNKTLCHEKFFLKKNKDLKFLIIMTEKSRGICSWKKNRFHNFAKQIARKEFLRVKKNKQRVRPINITVMSFSS